ncbi:hypothetical protein Tco_0606562 [Tanacetum coccineum]
MELVQGAMPICEGSCRLESFRNKWQEVGRMQGCKVRVGSNGNLLWEASVLLLVEEGCVVRMCIDYHREVVILENSYVMSQEGADDFIVYYDARSKDLEACLEKGEGDCLYVATTEGRMKDCHGYRSWLWVVEGLTLERCSTFGKNDKDSSCFDELRVLMPRVVKSRDEIFSRWGYCDNHDLSRICEDWDYQSSKVITSH